MESAPAHRPVPMSRVYGAGGSRRKRNPAPAAAMENAATKLREVARSTRLLRIDGFSSIPQTNGVSMDGHFEKTTWRIYGYDWEVRFYPSMKVIDPTKPSYPCMPDTLVAVELAFPSGSTSSEGEAQMGARLSCRLVDLRGKLKPSAGDHPGPSVENIVAFLVPRKHLAASGYLKHDSVAVECTIMVLMDSPYMTVLPDKQVPPSTLNQDLAQLQQSKTGADVTFLVSGESFAAHKVILAARSPVFNAEFFGDFGDKSAQQIQVEGIDAPAFKAMLNFIYTDTVSEFDQQSEAVTALAQHLVAAADRYGLDRLKMFCEEKLYYSIKAGSAATTLAFAEQHNCLQLKADCIDFIVSTPDILDEVLATDGYTHLVESHPSLLRDLLTSARGRKRQRQGI